MIIRSPFDDVPRRHLTVPELALRQAADLPHQVAIVERSSGRRTTYRELAELVSAWESRLRGWGMGPGQVTVVSHANRASTVAAMLAVMRLGAVVAPVHPSASAEEMADALRRTRATLLLVAPTDPRPREVSAGWSDLALVSAPVGEGPELVTIRIVADPAGLAADLDGVALLPASSGTSGVSKSVRVGHDNLVAVSYQTDAVIPTTPDEVVYCLPSVCHCFGLYTTAKTLSAGATILYPSALDARSMLRDFADERVTRASVIPTSIAMLARAPRPTPELDRLRFVLSGAGTLSPEIGRRCSEVLGVPLVQGYGLTEASPSTHLVPLERSVEKLGSIGACLPNTTARIVDPETEADLPPGEVGELWVHGPQVARGYLGSPSSASDAFRPDGWLRTGDLMRVDGDGYFTYVDRMKDVIKFRAHQIAPAELEAVLLQHPSVEEAAVVGMPDDFAGELPVAFVVLGERASPSELLDFAASRLSGPKRVRRLVVVDSLPKTPSGKVLRRTLRETITPAR